MKQEDKLGTLEEAIEFDKKRNYQYTASRLPTIVKDEQGKIVAVTLTNEEHQVQEVLWQAPRELSDDVVKELIDCLQEAVDGMGGAYAIWSPKAKAILKKASEK